MLDWPLLDGFPQFLLTALGVVSFGFLLYGRTKRWWTLNVPIAVGVGLVAAVIFKLVMDVIWKPFPEDPLPTVSMVAMFLNGAAVALAVMKPVRWPLRIVAVFAVIGVVISGAAAVNQHFAQYPTLGALFGADLANQSDFQNKDVVQPDQLVKAPAGAALSTVWKAPANMPTTGTVSTVQIPGTKSKFNARDAYVYLPPAYQSTPRAELPVIVLMAGQPGEPRDWFEAGKLSAVMDAYAAQHDGLAPVVVVVDPLGDSFANPGCVDSPQGNVFTYLSEDVPNWIKTNLQVVQDTTKWAIGGLSNGGTCALVLAVNAPDVYRTFMALSPEDQINVGDDAAATLNTLFGGSQAKFDAVNPLTVMKTKSFPDTAGFIVGGLDDSYLPRAQRVEAAAKAAGMDITYVELPGGHDWRVWGAGFQQALPWLANRMGLVAP